MKRNYIYKDFNPLNNMKIVLFALVFIIFSLQLPVVNAQEIAYFFKNTEIIDVKNPCFFNGTFCSAGASCQLTTYYPNNTIFVSNGQMTNQIVHHNYTLTGPYPLGVYKNDMICTDMGENGGRTFYFRVNTTGERGGGLSLFLILAIGSILTLLLAFAIQSEYISFISGILFVLTGVYSLIYGVADLSNLYTSGIGYVSIGLGAIFVIASGYSVANNSGLFDSLGVEDDD